MKRLLQLGIMTITICILFPLGLQAAPVGKVTAIEGEVDLAASGKEAKPVTPGDAVNVGDFIRTKSRSKCEVTFIDGNIIRLAESTRIQISEYMVENDNRRETIGLLRGKIRSIVQKGMHALGTERGGHYEVRTPTAVLGVRGSDVINYYLNGISGGILIAGNGYGYPLGNRQLVQNYGQGQMLMIIGINLPPILQPVNQQQIDQHIYDTNLGMGSGRITTITTMGTTSATTAAPSVPLPGTTTLTTILGTSTPTTAGTIGGKLPGDWIGSPYARNLQPAAFPQISPTIAPTTSIAPMTTVLPLTTIITTTVPSAAFRPTTTTGATTTATTQPTTMLTTTTGLSTSTTTGSSTSTTTAQSTTATTSVPPTTTVATTSTSTTTSIVGGPTGPPTTSTTVGPTGPPPTTTDSSSSTTTTVTPDSQSQTDAYRRTSASGAGTHFKTETISGSTGYTDGFFNSSSRTNFGTYTSQLNEMRWPPKSVAEAENGNIFHTLNLYPGWTSPPAIPAVGPGENRTGAMPVAGAWMNINEAMTGISGGQLSYWSHATGWQAVSAGNWIETNRFIHMISSAPGVLDRLNVPRNLIGSVTLGGANSNTNVSMTAYFFGYSTGAPRIFVSNNVSGTVSVNPTGSSLALSGPSGSGFTNNVHFTFTNWNTSTNKWAAMVNTTSAGQINPPRGPWTQMRGYSAGTMGPSSGALPLTTFSGTAAGVALP